MNTISQDAEVLCECAIPFDDIEVQLAPNSSRITLPELQAQVEQTWTRYTEESRRVGRNVWDGLLYRYEHCIFCDGRWRLTCSTIRAKDAISFRLIGGRSKYPPAVWSQNMFLGSLVRSRDGYALFGVPSGITTATRPFDLIGGVLSADEVQLTSGNDLVCIFQKELLEELNVEKDALTSIVLLGIVQTRTSSVGLVADARLSITYEEVQQRFNTRNDGELRGVKAVPERELEACLKQGGGYLPWVWKLSESRTKGIARKPALP